MAEKRELLDRNLNVATKTNYCLACDEVAKKARHRYYFAGGGGVDFASKFSA